MHQPAIISPPLHVRIGLSCLAAAMVAAPACFSDIIASDDFTYADGSVGGGEENGGTGWSGAWGTSSSVNSPSNEFLIASGEALFVGNTVNQEVITHTRDLASAATVGVLDTLTIDFDLIIGPADGQLGRGIALNFLHGGAVVLTVGKRINADIGMFADGLGGNNTSNPPLGGSTILRVADTIYNLSTTVTYDGTDTALSLTDGSTTLTATLAGTQLTIDGVQLTGYHRLTTGNGIDNLSIDMVTIPEPGTALLMGFGAAWLLLRRRRS